MPKDGYEKHEPKGFGDQTGANHQYGLIPENQTENEHNARIPVNANADIPMEVSRRTERIPETEKGFEPRTGMGSK